VMSPQIGIGRCERRRRDMAGAFSSSGDRTSTSRGGIVRLLGSLDFAADSKHMAHSLSNFASALDAREGAPQDRHVLTKPQKIGVASRLRNPRLSVSALKKRPRPRLRCASRPGGSHWRRSRNPIDREESEMIQDGLRPRARLIERADACGIICHVHLILADRIPKTIEMQGCFYRM
jgi:hypothetical protein